MSDTDTDLTLSATLTSGLLLQASRVTPTAKWDCKVYNPAGELMVMLSGFPGWSAQGLCAWLTENINPDGVPMSEYGVIGGL